MKFKDTYGATVTGDPETGWTRGGVSIGPCSQEQAASIFSGLIKMKDLRQSLDYAMHGLQQHPPALAMYNANLKNIFFAACAQIFRDQARAITGLEGMQINHPIHRKLKNLINFRHAMPPVKRAQELFYISF